MSNPDTNIKTLPLRKKIIQHVRKNIVSGLLILVPAGITFIALRFLFSLAGKLLEPLLKISYNGKVPEFLIISVSLLVLVIFTYLIGFFVSMVIGKRLVTFGEKILLRVPILRSIYSASKQAVEVFLARNEKSFQSVVLIEFPLAGSRSLGFVSGTIKDDKGNIFYKVFVPTTPNPTSGFLLIIREKDVHPAGISVEDAIKMIVSGGLVTPPNFRPEIK